MSITPSIRGRVPILYVRARANDRPRFNLPTWLEVNALATELQSYWRDNSQGALHLVSVVVPEEIVLPDSAATIADEKLTPRSKIAAEIRSVLTSPTGLGWDQSDLDRYYGVVGIVNCRSDGGATGGSGDVVFGAAQEPGQPGWRHCSGCQGLAFMDDRSPGGRCPAGVTHDFSTSGPYVVRFEPDGPGEAGWRYCSRCTCLAFAGAGAGVCENGVPHDTRSSGAYRAITTGTSSASAQADWRRCTRCQVLVFGPGGAGRCWAAGPGAGHTFDAKEYLAGLDERPALSWLAHEVGHALGLDHSFSDTPDPNDDRPGAYGDWWDIMSYGWVKWHPSSSLRAIGPALAAPTLFKNGWIGDDRLWTHIAAGPARHTIELLSTSEAEPSGIPTVSAPQTSGQQVVIGPPTPSTVEFQGTFARILFPKRSTVYTVEYRTPARWDRGIGAPGVLIREHQALPDTGSVALFSQNEWRYCSRCGSLVFRGHRACAAGGEHTSNGAHWRVSVGSAVPALPAEAGWRWCRRCQSMVQERGGPGLCSAGGAHGTDTSGDYWIPWGTAGDPASSLRWCRRCKCLHDSSRAAADRCASGEMHDDSESGIYRLSSDPGLASSQHGWTDCSKCSAVFFNQQGLCAAGAAHDTSQSRDYFLTVGPEGTRGQPGWRWCSKCYGLAYLDATRGPGRCPVKGTHDHSSSGHYRVEFTPTHDLTKIQQKWIDEVEDRGWAHCRLCEQLVRTTGGSRCPGYGSVHDLSGSGAYILRWEIGGHADKGRLQERRSFGAGDTYANPAGDLTVRILGFKATPARAQIEFVIR